jgi:hypothetical protein
LTLITLGVNRNWYQGRTTAGTKYKPQLVYEPQLVYHEPQVEKFEIRVNHNLEPRRPYKIYKVGSETLE